MNAIKTYEFEDGGWLQIFHDDNPSNPREFDLNVSTIIGFHPRYNIGDKNPYGGPKGDFYELDDVKSQIEADNDVVVIRPLYMYDHTGQAFSMTPFYCRWDSGQVGWIFATSESVKKVWGKEFAEVGEEKVLAGIQAELETYQQYANGEIFGFVLTVPKETCKTCGHQETEGDSCWGFYGSDPLENGMVDHLPEKYAKELKEVSQTA